MRPELELVCHCGTAELSAAAAARIDSLLHQRLDWSYLISRATLHGMLPLLYRHVAEPAERLGQDEQLATLYADVRRNTARVLQLSSVLLGILDRFSENGIQAVPYKGPPLSMRLYGDIGLRQAGDLDILIQKEDVGHAVELLRERGFDHFYGGAEATQAFRLANRYSVELIGPSRIFVELHWAFANRDVPFPMTFEDLEPRLTSVELGGRRIPAFDAEDLLLILSIHGAKHRWDRLEWIVGVAELIRANRGLNLEIALSRAESLRALRSLLLALGVANDLLGVELDEPVRQRIQRDRWISKLIRDVRTRYCEDPSYPGTFSEVLSRNLFQLPLQTTGIEKWRYLKYRMTTPNQPDDWKMLAVGGRSLPVHAITWPLRLLAKLVTIPIRYRER